MKLSIYTQKLEKEDNYIAMVDWFKYDGGEVGTPAAVKYGITKELAYNSLKKLLEKQGHTVLL